VPAALEERERWPEGRPWWVDGIMDGPEAKAAGSPVMTSGYRAHLDRIRRTAAARAWIGSVQHRGAG
jgi:hypothetical protein